MHRAPLVSVIVPNWNGLKLLPDLVDGLAVQSFRDFETIIVDNGSQDGSVAWIEERPEIRLVKLKANRGFAAAVNEGVAASNGDLIALLNNDMVPAPEFLQALVRAAGIHPGAGSFAAKVLFRHDPRRVDSSGDQLHPSGRASGIGRGELDGPRFDEPRWVFGATGGAVLYRWDLLNQVGGFDEEFFLYVEDTDLAMRAQLYGWKCLYVPDAVALHVGSGSMKGREDARARYCLRNYLYFLTKTYPLPLLWSNRGAVLRRIAIECRFAFGASRVQCGAVRALALVLWAILTAIVKAPRMLWRRFKVERRVPLQAIRDLMAAEP